MASSSGTGTLAHCGDCRVRQRGRIVAGIDALLQELRHDKLLWLPATMPLAALLSRTTEGVAARTGDAIDGLLNTTLGNLTELVIALTALRAVMLYLMPPAATG